jgi:hypothetical protein
MTTKQSITGSQLINILASAAEVLSDYDDSASANMYASISEQLGALEESYTPQLDAMLEAAVDVGALDALTRDASWSDSDDSDSDPEACPGCGCKPGDGLTASCEHPDGCGFNRAELSKALEAAHPTHFITEHAVDIDDCQLSQLVGDRCIVVPNSADHCSEMSVVLLDKSIGALTDSFAPHGLDLDEMREHFMLSNVIESYTGNAREMLDMVRDVYGPEMVVWPLSSDDEGSAVLTSVERLRERAEEQLENIQRWIESSSSGDELQLIADELNALGAKLRK